MNLFFSAGLFLATFQPDDQSGYQRTHRQDKNRNNTRQINDFGIENQIANLFEEGEETQETPPEQ